MSQTYLNLMDAVDELVGEQETFTTSAAGDSGGADLISSDLLKFSGGSFLNWFIEILDGARDGDIRKALKFEISSATPPVATLTPYNPFGGQIANSVTFKVLRADPDWKRSAINQALVLLTNVLPLEIEEFLTTGELLRNPNFEFWNRQSLPYDWVDVGTTAPAKNTANPYERESAVDMANDSIIQQRLLIERDLRDLTLSFTGQIWSAAAGPVLRIYSDGGSSDSNAHTGGSSYEELTASRAVADATRPVYVELRGGGAVVSQFDALSLRTSDNEPTYLIPISDAFRSVRQMATRPPLFGTNLVQTADAAMQPFDNWVRPAQTRYGGFYRYRYRFSQNTPLRIIGARVHDSLSADTDTIDIEEHEKWVVAVKAAIILVSRLLRSEFAGDKRHWATVEEKLKEDEVTFRASLHGSRSFLLPFPSMNQ